MRLGLFSLVFYKEAVGKSVTPPIPEDSAGLFHSEQKKGGNLVFFFLVNV